MAKVRQAHLCLTLASILVTAGLFAAEPAWIQYGHQGPLARVITKARECPPITIDGGEHPMRVHSSPSTDYPVTVCEASLAEARTSASIGGVALPVGKLRRSERIALLGDTGCRRKAGSPPQDCSDPKKWPFATIAASIAEFNPDAVLHVGDYYYREAASCTATACQGTKYDWSRWNADFFTPAAPLLANAPWIFTRGNHEECGRAAEGWVRFLDPRNYVWENDRTCKSNLMYTPPYTVHAGDLHLGVLDSSAAKDSDATQSAMYAGQLGVLGKETRKGSWLMLHHPIWAVDYTDQVTEMMWTAWNQAGSAISPLSLVLAGHVHLLEVLSYSDNRVPHVIVGNGATSLDGPPSNAQGTTIGGRTVSSFLVDDDFGFIAATRTATGWTFDIRDSTGKSKTKCAVTEQGIVCD
jgi:hypothetical protein